MIRAVGRSENPGERPSTVLIQVFFLMEQVLISKKIERTIATPPLMRNQIMKSAIGQTPFWYVLIIHFFLPKKEKKGVNISIWCFIHPNQFLRIPKKSFFTILEIRYAWYSLKNHLTWNQSYWIQILSIRDIVYFN